WLRKLELPGHLFANNRLGNDGERHLQVCSTAGKRTHDVHHHSGVFQGRARDMPVYSAESSRDAQRAGEVTAQFECRQSRGQSSGSSAGTPARSAREIPGMVGPTKERITGLPVRRARRKIRLAYEVCLWMRDTWRA